MIALKNVLVATDFSDPSLVALTYGRDLARSFGATLHVLNVVDDVGTRAAAMAGYGIDFERIQAEMEGAARQQVDGLLSDEDRTQLGAKVAVVSSGGTANAIVDYARDHHINLIIVGTHGRGPVAHVFIGSVAEKVVRLAPCPVLTVRHPEVEFVLPDALERVETARSTAAH
jgi:nucleotide-binding universal stress UspA family protein